MYELESENLTGLGGPMGTERTWPNWRKFFRTAEAAKVYAERDFKKSIEWSGGLVRGFSSGDLGHVMYHIRLVKIEE